MLFGKVGLDSGGDEPPIDGEELRAVRRIVAGPGEVDQAGDHHALRIEVRLQRIARAPQLDAAGEAAMRNGGGLLAELRPAGLRVVGRDSRRQPPQERRGQHASHEIVIEETPDQARQGGGRVQRTHLEVLLHGVAVLEDLHGRHGPQQQLIDLWRQQALDHQVRHGVRPHLRFGDGLGHMGTDDVAIQLRSNGLDFRGIAPIELRNQQIAVAAPERRDLGPQVGQRRLQPGRRRRDVLVPAPPGILEEQPA